MNRFLCCRTLLLLGFVAVVAPACEGEVAPPETGLILEVRRPAADQDPFADPQVAFVELTAEGPDITPDQVQIVQKYTPGMQIELPTVPFGTKRQIRVGLWPKNAKSGLPAAPMLASGRTVPRDLVAGGLAIKLLPYVTRVNEFANVVNEINQPSLTDARIGATAVSASDSAVIIIGGATPKESATDPFDPASYQA